MRASGPDALAHLDAAAQGGNRQAAIHLVQLTRDGNHMNIFRDLKGARAALDKYLGLIGPDDSWRLERTIEAARARTPEALARWAPDVTARPEMMTKAFAKDLHNANPNAVIYLLQLKFKAAGWSTGRADGYAGSRTLRALNKACRAAEKPLHCDDSVMRPDILVNLLAGN